MRVSPDKWKWSLLTAFSAPGFLDHHLVPGQAALTFLLAVRISTHRTGVCGGGVQSKTASEPKWKPWLTQDVLVFDDISASESYRSWRSRFWVKRAPPKEEEPS